MMAAILVFISLPFHNKTNLLNFPDKHPPAAEKKRHIIAYSTGGNRFLELKSSAFFLVSF